MNLDGRHKAAIALLSLDEDIATSVLAQMPEADVRTLCSAVTELEDVGQDVIVRVLEELEVGLISPLAMVKTGGPKYVRKLADKAFGADRAERLLTPPGTQAEPLVLLRTARVNAIAQLLTEEHPQIAAVVLTQLPSGVAAKVLALMSSETAADLMGRLAELEEVPEHAVTEASESLVRALEAAGALATNDTRAEFDGLAFSAAIVNELSQEKGDDLLGLIGERSEQIASRIREAMFTFDDLRKIPTREMGNLLRSVQSESLVTALQTAPTEVREHFFASLSQRAAGTLRDDLMAAAPKRLSEVEAAQREVVEAAMRLADEGKLTLPQRGEG